MVEEGTVMTFRLLAMSVAFSGALGCDGGACDEAIPAQSCAIEAPCGFGVAIDAAGGEECPDSSLVEVECRSWDYRGDGGYPLDGPLYCMPEEDLIEYVGRCVDDDVPCDVELLRDEDPRRYRATCGIPELGCR